MTLQTQLIEYINKHDKAWCCKVMSANVNGIGDIIGGVNSWSFMAEVKELGDLPKPWQYERLAQATRAKCFACIVTVPGNVKACKAALEKEYAKCLAAGQEVTKVRVLTLMQFKMIFFRLHDERTRSYKYEH